MQNYHFVLGRGGVRLDLSFKATTPVDALHKLYNFIRQSVVLDAYCGNPKDGDGRLDGTTSYPELVGRSLFEHEKAAPLHEEPVLLSTVEKPDENTPEAAEAQTPAMREQRKAERKDERDAARAAERAAKGPDPQAAKPRRSRKKAEEPPADNQPPAGGDQTTAPEEQQEQ